MLGVCGEVEVRAVRDAFQLGELRAADAIAVFDVDRPLRVMRQLLLWMLKEAQIFLAQAEVEIPPPAFGDPVLVPLLVRAWLDEVLHLHLLELAGPEDEIARGDLVPERLAGLRDAERRLLPRGLHDVEEVDEDALSGLRP